MKHQVRYRAIGVALMAVCIAACAGTAALVSSPTVNLTSVELASASLSRQTFHLGFNVDNPNPFPLPVTGVEYRVILDDQRFAGGETQGGFTVPARGQDAFVISVDIDLISSANQFALLFRRGMPEQVNYELQGSLTVDIPFTRPIPFSSTGVIHVD
jgi:LEA14-like dessication related protein